MKFLLDKEIKFPLLHCIAAKAGRILTTPEAFWHRVKCTRGGWGASQRKVGLLQSRGNGGRASSQLTENQLRHGLKSQSSRGGHPATPQAPHWQLLKIERSRMRNSRNHGSCFSGRREEGRERMESSLYWGILPPPPCL